MRLPEKGTLGGNIQKRRNVLSELCGLSGRGLRTRICGVTGRGTGIIY